MARHDSDEGTSLDQPFIFDGIDSPNSTSFPDVLLDRVMAHTSGAEFKVLAYIVRRTFGFKKNSDSISLDQICHGITRRDGSILDEGTGLTRKTAIAALKGLEDKGVITVVRRSSPTKGNLPSTFALRFRTQPDLADDPRQAPTEDEAEEEEEQDPGRHGRDRTVTMAGRPATQRVPHRGPTTQTHVGVQKRNQGGEDVTLPLVQNSFPRGIVTTRGRGKKGYSQQTEQQQTGTSTDVVVVDAQTADALEDERSQTENAFTAEQGRVLSLLLGEGVAPSRALNLCARFSVEAIEQQIGWLDKRRYDDRAACLVAAIEHAYSPPVASTHLRNATGGRAQRTAQRHQQTRTLEPSHYTRGSYGVCPACGCSPCDADCPNAP